MFCRVSLFYLIALPLAVAVAQIKYVSPKLPKEWTTTDVDVSAPPVGVMPVLLSLRQSNLNELKKLVQRVSDPRSPSYGQYLSATAVSALTNPRETDINVVEHWLTRAGVSFKRTGQTISADMNPEEVANLFQTKVQWATNNATGQTILIAHDYWLPADVDASTAAVYGLHDLPLPPRKKIISAPDAPMITPSVIKQTYGIEGVTPSNSTRNRQAVVEFEGQTMLPRDLKLYFSTFVPDAPEYAHKVYKFVGRGRPVGQGAIEASLDIQVLMGVAPGVLTEFWYFKSTGPGFCHSLKTWTTRLLATEDPPLVFSVSYGWQRSLKAVRCSPDAIADLDMDFAKIAARGISVIISSGDSGAGYPGPKCKDQSQQYNNTALEGGETGVEYAPNRFVCCYVAMAIRAYAWSYECPNQNCSAPNKRNITGKCTYYANVTKMISKPGTIAGGDGIFDRVVPLTPSWPASSPYVTAVGATRFMRQTVGNNERAVDSYGSGGGFSFNFDSFTDQREAVASYLEQAADSLPPRSTFPPSGRATPDLAALGEGFVIVSNYQNVTGVGGTSASAPVVAVIIGLINDARLSAGKGPMGLLNPWLYQNPNMFNDVLVGNNSINTYGEVGSEGYICAKGWDPVTGLGTPIFERMLESALAIGTARDAVHSSR